MYIYIYMYRHIDGYTPPSSTSRFRQVKRGPPGGEPLARAPGAHGEGAEDAEAPKLGALRGAQGGAQCDGMAVTRGVD